MIKQKYFINNKTLAVLPAKEIEFDSIIIEKKKTIHVRKTPLQIINESCRRYWSTYEGRREAVMHHMGYKQKVPIPICIIKNIYFFPTHSPYHIDNCWIASQHIQKIEKMCKHSKRKSNIQFISEQVITLNVSLNTLLQQIKRTNACMYKIREVKNVKI